MAVRGMDVPEMVRESYDYSLNLYVACRSPKWIKFILQDRINAPVKNRHKIVPVVSPGANGGQGAWPL